VVVVSVGVMKIIYMLSTNTLVDVVIIVLAAVGHMAAFRCGSLF
jgi:hypothetical protein